MKRVKASSALGVVLLLVLLSGCATNSPLTVDKSMTQRSETQESEVLGMPTDDEVIQHFTDYLAERAESNVLIAKAVESITFESGIVKVVFDPQLANIPDPSLVLELNPFDNLAEFVGTPIAFTNDEGKYLRQVVTGVVTELSDGSSLGRMTTAEIFEMGTGLPYTAGD